MHTHSRAQYFHLPGHIGVMINQAAFFVTFALKQQAPLELYKGRVRAAAAR